MPLLGNQNITDDQIRSFIQQSSNPDQIYQAAQKHGVSTQQIANAMQGTPYTKQALDQYVTNQQTNTSAGLLNTKTPVTTHQQGPYIDPRANTLYGAGNPSITSQDIQNFIGQGKSPDEIYNEALRRGISADQVTQAMQGTPYTGGAINQFIGNQGVSRDMLAPAAQAPNVQLPEWRPAPFTQATRDPVQGTVAGNLDQVLDPNSPLMQRAAAMGLQQANRRGLLNSSIGISAAQNAMVDAGLQIATPDAASHNQFALQNAEAQNLQDRFNEEQRQRLGMFSSDLIAQQGRFNVSQVNEMLGLQLGHQHQARQTQLENQFRAQLENNANARAMWMEGMSRISQLQNNMEMTEGARQQAINEMFGMMHDGLAITGALSNTGLAEAFGNRQQTGTGTGGGTGTGDVAVKSDGTPVTNTAGEPVQRGTSPITGEPIGPTGQGTFVLGSGEKITEAGASALQQIYGVDPMKVVKATVGISAHHNVTQLGNMTPTERAEFQALQAKYPTTEQLRQAVDSGQVHVLQLADPKYGEVYHPDFKGIETGTLYFDPNNIFGLWA